MKAKGKTTDKWVTGLLLVACVAAMYITYHYRNWALLGPVVKMLRPWWYALRIALGV